MRRERGRREREERGRGECKKKRREGRVVVRVEGVWEGCVREREEREV